MSSQTKELKTVYTCDICGNNIELLYLGAGTFECCKQPMTAQVENTVDAAREKHVPIITRSAEGITVTVGAVPHPMEEKHYIAWIELIADGVSYRKMLKPGDAPTAFFALKAENAYAREYCTLHGLWKGE